MKIMGIYLPAFHRIPENDKWWGDGFTEWDNVKSGKSYYPGHCQPVEPLDDWYYDLSNRDDIVKQAQMAKSHGVDGFLMYHYWFGDGRMLFTKPAELIKEDSSIDIEYSFCWANGTWVTTWHGKDPEELIRQNYPGKGDWAKHLDYLLPFFRDDRYSKIDGKPVFYFYKADEIPQYSEMIEYWDSMLKKQGFNGLYAVEYISSKNKRLFSSSSSAVMEFEPLYTCYFDLTIFEFAKRAIAKFMHKIDYQSYDRLWEKIVNRKRTYSGKPIIRGCFCGWDNSPRKEFDSMVVKGSSPEKFGANLLRLMTSGRVDASKDYLVINAWNEWSEGAYLEPDKKNGYGYLNAVKAAVEKAGFDV